MGLTLRSFLLFLRHILSFFRRRWEQSTRKLWYIFGFLHSYISSKRSGEDGIHPRTESWPPKPTPTPVICASRLPNPLPPIIGGETPVLASRTPISIEVRPPTILVSGDPLDDSQETNSPDHLGVGSYALEECGTISRSYGFSGHHNGPGTRHPKDFAPNSPLILSGPPSQCSYDQVSPYPGQSSFHPVPPYPGYRRGSQDSHHPPSVYSSRSMHNSNGAETAARGYLQAPPSPRPSSIALSVRPPSVAGSAASHVYRASRPKTRTRMPSPMGNTPGRRNRSSTPASTHRSVYDPPLDVATPEFPQPGFRTSECIHHDQSSVAVSFSQLQSPPMGKLRPMIGINRYEKHSMVTVENAANAHVCPPVMTQFTRESAPENWIPLMHPEGALYWVHEKNPIYTDTDLCNPDLRQRIEEALQEINELKESCPSLPEDWELALELNKDDETGEPICSYYFVCLSTRCLFWLHDFDLESILIGLRGVTEWTHIHLALQAQYWSHWEMFPHNREVPEYVVQELLGILVHAGVDCMTSSNSTAAYSEEDLSKLLGYVKHVTSVGGNYGFSACVVGRLMSFFTFSRYINFYGQKGARLTNDQTIYGFQPKRTYVIRIMSILFFFAPELHLKGLESVYTDFVLCQHRWAQFATRLQADWTEFVLYGAVVLVANVAFLAIPSVDSGDRIRSPAQLASYFSIIASVGSVVTGLLLLRQYRTKPQEAAEEADKYLRSRHNSAFGFEVLAILYSLPYALLLWAMVTFAAAFGIETLAFSQQTWGKLSVGIVLAMMALLVFWCVWTAVEVGTGFSLLSYAHHWRGRISGITRGTFERRPDMGGEGGNGQLEGKGSKYQGSGSLKEAFNFIRRTRRRGTTGSSTLASPKLAGSDKVSCPPDSPEVGGVIDKEQESAV